MTQSTKVDDSLGTEAAAATDNDDNDNDDAPPLLILDRTRVRDAAGYRGTVAYVGPVASATDPTAVYVGVRWDDPEERGRHNGSVVCRTTGALVRHFDCAHPTGASFVKMAKVDTGRVWTPALLQADRYVALDDATRVAAPGTNLLQHTARTSSGRPKAIELLGELQIRPYQQVATLTTVSLRLAGLRGMRESHSWTTSLAHVRTLDLAGNLFADWSILRHVLLHLGGTLDSVSLASNRLGDWTAEDATWVAARQGGASPVLTTLNVRDCHIGSIDTVIALGQWLPHVTQVGLGQARLTDLCASKHATALAQAWPRLRLLDLSQGHLDRPDQVAAWASLRALESLSLDENPLTTWPVPSSDEVTWFPNLMHVQLAGTAIASLAALDGLQACPRWESLRLQATPLGEAAGAATLRSQLIARLEALHVLNASTVTATEREQSERRYVATLTRAWQQASQEANSSAAQQALLQEHPTYPALAEKHATVREAIQAEAAAGGSRNGGLHWSDSLATLTIRSMVAQSCERPPLIRRFPTSLTVAKLKALLARHFGLDWDLQELTWQEPSTKDSLPTLLEEDEQSLAYYGVTDGATIFLHEVDVRARQEAHARAKQKEKDRLYQQERELQDFVNVQKKIANM
jgi:hypothetical protein